MAVSQYNYNFQMDDSDEEFEQSAEDRYVGKTALVILIETTPKMFTENWGDENKDEDKDSDSSTITPFSAAIKCCESIWRTKVISNPQDLVSIIFYGTEKSKNSSGFPNIYEYQELSSVTVDMIKNLMELKLAPDYFGFSDNIGSSDKYSLKDVAWLIKMNLDKAKTGSFSKKILLFTMEDNPHGDNPNLQTDAVSKFKDLGNFEFNIISFKDNFEFDKFYSKIVEDDSVVSYAKPQDLDKLQQVVRMKQRLRRPLSRSTLELTSEVKIGVGFYSLVRQAKPPKSVSINRRNNEVIERHVNVFRSDTGMSVLKSEERKMVEIQGEVAVFTPQEVKEIKYVQEPGVKLLGFLRAEDFNNFKWYRSPPYFLYPDEQRISGSKDVFTMLLRRCKLLERVALVRYVLSRGKSPKLGLLIPSLPEGDSKEIFPEGFHLFPVPFSDEMRKHDIESEEKASPELIEMMNKVIKKLTFSSFNVLNVQNPSLQSIWAKVEEEALEEKVDDDFFDYTEANVEMMKKRLKTLPLEITNEVDRISTTFRSSKSTLSIQKKKTNKGSVDISMEAKHGRLNSCTCDQLKQFLESRHVAIPFRTRKADLIDLVNTELGIDN